MSKIEFKGYAVTDTKKFTELKVVDFTPKKLDDYDVEIAIEYCGVCGSDTHSASGGWGEPDILPLIVGHEITGHVTQVGSKVTEFKKGDRAGVGAQVLSCLECSRCKSDNENYCTKSVDTYNAKYDNGDVAQGGFATGIRCHQRFTFKIPDEISLQQASSMMCGGLTVYSPLVRHGCKPGARVAVVGIGGLGHYAIQFAAALGAKEVIAISHSESKREDAMKMGATSFIISEGSEKGLKDQVSDLDLVINTVDLASAVPLTDLLSIVKMHGKVISVGLPNDPLPPTQAQAFAGNGALFGVTHIGSKKEIIDMLKLAVEKGVKTWVVEMPMKEAGKALGALKGNGDSSVRYRQVLTQDLQKHEH